MSHALAKGGVIHPRARHHILMDPLKPSLFNNRLNFGIQWPFDMQNPKHSSQLGQSRTYILPPFVTTRPIPYLHITSIRHNSAVSVPTYNLVCIKMAPILKSQSPFGTTRPIRYLHLTSSVSRWLPF